MNTTGPIISLSEFKARAAQLLDQINASGQEIVLTQNGSATAVVQDYASYHELKEALAMMKLMVQGEADIRAGRLAPQAQMFTRIKERVAGGERIQLG